jgi:hypothetical protein
MCGMIIFKFYRNCKCSIVIIYTYQIFFTTENVLVCLKLGFSHCLWSKKMPFVETMSICVYVIWYQWLNHLSNFYYVFYESSSQKVVEQAWVLCWLSDIHTLLKSASEFLPVGFVFLDGLGEVWYTRCPRNATQQLMECCEECFQA